MSDIETINLRTCKNFGRYPYDVYVGRKSYYRHASVWLAGSPLGNPFDTKIHTVESHRAVVNDYIKVFLMTYDNHDEMIPPELKWNAEEARSELTQLEMLFLEHNKLRIACWCKPLPCHSTIIKLYLQFKQQETDKTVDSLERLLRNLSPEIWYEMVIRCNDCDNEFQMKTNGSHMHFIDMPNASIIHPQGTVLCTKCHSRNTEVTGVRLI